MTQECFLICPIGSEDSDERKNSDKLLKHVLTPVAQETGYTLVRADRMSESGLITTQILNKIIDCPLVIADLSGGNPNVFYELALRHAVQKPYIQLIQDKERVPFDVSGVRTIHYDLGDLDKVEQTKIEIASQIKTIQSGHLPDSPISLAVTSDVTGISANALKVFLEKFWDIEADLNVLRDNMKSIERGIDEISDVDIEYLVESAIDNKLLGLADEIATEVAEKLTK